MTSRWWLQYKITQAQYQKNWSNYELFLGGKSFNNGSHTHTFSFKPKLRLWSVCDSPILSLNYSLSCCESLHHSWSQSLYFLMICSSFFWSSIIILCFRFIHLDLFAFDWIQSQKRATLDKFGITLSQKKQMADWLIAILIVKTSLKGEVYKLHTFPQASGYWTVDKTSQKVKIFT